MKKITQEEQTPRLAYENDAMAKGVCLICGERVGQREYRGKAVCSECLKSIREKF